MFWHNHIGLTDWCWCNVSLSLYYSWVISGQSSGLVWMLSQNLCLTEQDQNNLELVQWQALSLLDWHNHFLMPLIVVLSLQYLHHGRYIDVDYSSVAFIFSLFLFGLQLNSCSCTCYRPDWYTSVFANKLCQHIFATERNTTKTWIAYKHSQLFDELAGEPFYHLMHPLGSTINIFFPLWVDVFW
jgi:hypothetical protein